MQNITQMKDAGWQQVLNRLGKYLDLETTAREHGAIQRSRKIRNAADLLRIIFAYCGCQMSLRGTAMWATLQDVGNVSDVAVLKRIRNALPWLQHILSVLIKGKIEGLLPDAQERQVYLIDATYMKAYGRQGHCWRWHMMFHLNSQSIRFGFLTDQHICESLTHYPVEKDGIYIADRGYARAKQVCYIMEHGGEFIVRGGAQTFTLRKPDGSIFRSVDELRNISGDEPQEFVVQLAKDHHTTEIIGSARLIVVRNSDGAHQRNLARLKEKARKNQTKRRCQISIDMAQYFCVLTSLPVEEYDAQTILNLYKLRWQVEIAFKRLKSLVRIDKFVARSDLLTQCYITAGLILGLLVEDEAGSIPILLPFRNDGRNWSLWRLQSHILMMFRTMIAGFLDITSYLRKLSLLRRNICEPPRKRECRSIQQIMWSAKNQILASPETVPLSAIRSPGRAQRRRTQR